MRAYKNNDKMLVNIYWYNQHLLPRSHIEFTNPAYK
jgi:hypothetical protein